MIAGVFQRTFSGERFWVIAEVISLKVSRGHCYLQLAEKDENTVTPKAEFRGIIWGGTFERLNASFLEATETEFGVLDVLVNNAGLLRMGPLVDAAAGGQRAG